LRSFADGNGDGVGDLAGCRARLPYLAELGIDAIWFSPWYLSPMADGGYDVADCRQIDPQFGTIGDAESLISEAHALGIRVILDIVPNHASDQHPWFVAALAARPGSRERRRFHFRSGRGSHGELPPNNWLSEFGGPAWSRTTGPDGSPGEGYLHLFAPEQPDFNWESPEVKAELEAILRFWFDRGADGFRVDSAALLAKHRDLADVVSG
jgi:alpha-glucosidase